MEFIYTTQIQNQPYPHANLAIISYLLQRFIQKTEHFKALSKHDHSSGIADQVEITGHNIKWDHFDILASGN